MSNTIPEETPAQADATSAALRSAFQLAREMLAAAKTSPECASMMSKVRLAIQHGARLEISFAFATQTDIVLGVVDPQGTRVPIASIGVSLPNPTIN